MARSASLSDWQLLNSCLRANAGLPARDNVAAPRCQSNSAGGGGPVDGAAGVQARLRGVAWRPVGASMFIAGATLGGRRLKLLCAEPALPLAEKLTSRRFAHNSLRCALIPISTLPHPGFPSAKALRTRQMKVPLWTPPPSHTSPHPPTNNIIRSAAGRHPRHSAVAALRHPSCEPRRTAQLAGGECSGLGLSGLPRHVALARQCHICLGPWVRTGAGPAFPHYLQTRTLPNLSPPLLPAPPPPLSGAASAWRLLCCGGCPHQPCRHPPARERPGYSGLPAAMPVPRPSGPLHRVCPPPPAIPQCA